MGIKKVLVLGNDERSTLAVIRSLGREGISIDIGWSTGNALLRHSKYLANIVDIPTYCPDNNLWLDFLLEHLACNQYDLVIPCTDPTIIPLHLHRDAISAHANLYLISPKAFDICQSKLLSYELAKQLNLKLAKSFDITTPDELNDIKGIISYPAVLKPMSSFNETNVSGKNIVQKASDSQELLSLAAQMLNVGPIQIQENFIGTGVGVEVLAKEGKILFSFQHERVHEPLEGGGSSYRKSCSVNSELFEASAKLIEKLNYTGVGMIEFIFNHSTQQWIFIEINARFWGSLPLAVASGANFPYYLYQMLVDGTETFNPEYKVDHYCRNLSRDINWLIENIKAPKNQKHLHTRSYSSIFFELKNILLAREHFDTLCLDDRSPGVEDIKRIADSNAIKVRSKIFNRLAAKSKILGKLYRYIAKKRLKSAQNILIVCKGNICRSSFAEKIMLEHYPDKTITSAGYFRKSNRPCPDLAIEVANEMGLDLSKHRSSKLTQEAIDNADVVMIFDEENYDTVCRGFANARKKLVFYGLLDTATNYFIADPYGHSKETFSATYQRITNCSLNCPS